MHMHEVMVNWELIIIIIKIIITLYYVNCIIGTIISFIDKCLHRKSILQFDHYLHKNGVSHMTIM